MAWTYPLINAVAAAARRRGLPGPRSAAATLHRHRALDAALAAAWDTAGRRGQARIVDLQLTRRTPAAAEALVTRLHALDAPVRAVMLDRVSDLHAALRRLLGRPAAAGQARLTGAQACINALWLIEYGNAGALAYLALPRLRDPDAAVRDAASACLLGLADGRHRPAIAATAHDAPDGRRAAALAESLDQAVVQYRSHLNPGALRAWVAQGAAAFAPESAALQALNDAEHAAVPALRALLKDAGGPAIRGGLIGLLGVPNLALASLAGLRHVAQEGPIALAQVLHGRGHLLDLPAVRRGIARGGAPEGLWPADFSGVAALPACDALPAWADALPGSPRKVLSRLAPLTATGPAGRRLDALRRVERCGRPAGPDGSAHAAAPAFRSALHAVLAPLTADPDARIAAPASALAQRLSTGTKAPRNRPGGRFRAPGRPDPHAPPPGLALPGPSVSSVPRCRRAAARRVAATAFEPLWHAWPRLATTQRRRAAAAALRLDPTARERLRIAAAAFDSEVRTRARTMLDAAAATAAPRRRARQALQESAS